jgi:hypothetical protein
LADILQVFSSKQRMYHSTQKPKEKEVDQHQRHVS